MNDSVREVSTAWLCDLVSALVSPLSKLVSLGVRGVDLMATGSLSGLVGDVAELAGGSSDRTSTGGGEIGDDGGSAAGPSLSGVTLIFFLKLQEMKRRVTSR